MKRLVDIKFENGEQYYKKLHLFFNLTAAIPLLPFTFLYLERSNDPEAFGLASADLSQVLLFALPLMIAATTYFAIKLYRRHALNASEMTLLRDKMVLYFNAALWKFATLEIALLIAVSGLYFTNHWIFIVLFVGILVLLSLGRPTIRKVVVDLRLNREDEKILIDKLSIE
jgi:hypothetical protein